MYCQHCGKHVNLTPAAPDKAKTLLAQTRHLRNQLVAGSNLFARRNETWQTMCDIDAALYHVGEAVKRLECAVTKSG